MFGKVIFPRRAANASPCLDFIIADMFRSVLSNGERIFGKFWGRVLRKDDVKLFPIRFISFFTDYAVFLLLF